MTGYADDLPSLLSLLAMYSRRADEWAKVEALELDESKSVRKFRLIEARKGRKRAEARVERVTAKLSEIGHKAPCHLRLASGDVDS
jgi:hypothetical protein